MCSEFKKKKFQNMQKNYKINFLVAAQGVYKFLLYRFFIEKKFHFASIFIKIITPELY